MFLDEGHVGQAFSDLTGLSNDELSELLPTHGFASGSIEWLRKGDRASMIQARLKTLIAGEREFMNARNVVLPTARTGANIADSDVSDGE